jgi:hypothetical protein
MENRTRVRLKKRFTIHNSVEQATTFLLLDYFYAVVRYDTTSGLRAILLLLEGDLALYGPHRGSV